MKTVVLPRPELIRRAVDEICDVIHQKPDAVITMAAGRSMLPVWQLLGERVAAGFVSLRDVRFFQTAEFLDCPEGKSLRCMTENNLLKVADLQKENCFWLTEQNLAECDEQISNAGGLDLAVLGIGCNAHIGFNEPATQYDTRCRIQKLTDKTKKQYAWLFDGAEHVPEKACTMGIHTLIDARKIMVVSFGEEKAQATFDMLYARDDSVIPAAFLQLPFDVTVFADPEAAGKL